MTDFTLKFYCQAYLVDIHTQDMFYPEGQILQLHWRPGALCLSNRLLTNWSKVVKQNFTKHIEEITNLPLDYYNRKIAPTYSEA